MHIILFYVKMAAFLIFAIVLVSPHYCLGSFSWKIIPKDVITFQDSDTVVMIWDYATDEQVLSVEWFKQPGNILLARKFGSSDFEASKSYTGRVSRHETSRFSSAIQVLYFADSDDGVYTCNVTTSSRKSSKDITVSIKARRPSPPQINSLRCYAGSKADISFKSGFNGESLQIFYVEIRTKKDSSFQHHGKGLPEINGQTFYNTTIVGLKAETSYSFRILAQNRVGETHSEDVYICTIQPAISGAAVLGRNTEGVLILAIVVASTTLMT